MTNPIVSTGYSIAQVAKQVGVSSQTIRRRVREGIIPAKCFGPKSTRIDRETLHPLIRHPATGLRGS